MRLDLNLGYSGIQLASHPDLVRRVESLGYHTVWVAEAYGSDAVTVASTIVAHSTTLGVGTAILQIPGRTPAMTAMTAATLDDLSGGRFRLGVGVSGPQVAEGWHGEAFGKPLAKTREYVSIVRKILAREEPVTAHGEYYQLPFLGDDATGLGKPLKLIGRPHPGIPIYIAAIGPNNVALTAEIGDGWLPVFFSPERAPEVFGASLVEGFARSGEEAKSERFDIVPTVYAFVSDDIDEGRDRMRPMIALYIGGMGARGRNFYNDLAVRYGFEEAAVTIQDLYLAGEKAAAEAAVPVELIDEVALCGPASHIAERLEVWRASGVGAIAIGADDPKTIATIASL